MAPRWVIKAFLIVSFVGFWDALYLTVLHYQGIPPTCSIFQGCQQVAASPYAVIWGVPVALLGVLYYLTVFLLILIHLLVSEGSSAGRWVRWVRSRLIIWVSRLTVIGFLFSLWLVYLQLFVIKSICLYCMISAATSTVLFVLGMVVMKKRVK